MQAPIVSLSNVDLTLTSRAGSVKILRDINLEINRGQSVSIVGPSGSGKTSLLMIMSGLEPATSGKVIIAGHNFKALSHDAITKVRGKDIGIVFQSFHLVPTMTALENVALPLEFRGDAGAIKTANELLEKVGLSSRAQHFPAELSGGEQQRVAIARALSTRPQLILADEPTGNLDAKTGEQIINTLFDLKTQYDATLILVTHDQSVADKCDRHLKMIDGTISSSTFKAAAE